MGPLASLQHHGQTSGLQSGRLLEACAALIGEAYEKTDLLEHWEEAWDGPMAHVPMGTALQRFLVSDAGDTMVVSLPGTTRLGDWACNLSVTYEPVAEEHAAEVAALSGAAKAKRLGELPCAHAGFLHRARTVPVHALLRRAEEAGKKRVVFTGHSLGGSVAVLAALLMLMHQERRGPQPQQRAPPGGRQQHGQQEEEGEPPRVDVQCLSFAAPVCCNEPLAALAAAKGWRRRFHNVVIPEDYCLKLFNGVLQSAANPEWLAAVHHALFSEGRAHGAGAGAAAGTGAAAAVQELPPPVLGAPPVLKPVCGLPLELQLEAARGGGNDDDEGGKGDGFGKSCAAGGGGGGGGGAGLLCPAPSFLLLQPDGLIQSYAGPSDVGAAGPGSTSGAGSSGSSDSGSAAGGGAVRRRGAQPPEQEQEEEFDAAGSVLRLRLGSMASSRSFGSFKNLFLGQRVTITHAAAPGGGGAAGGVSGGGGGAGGAGAQDALARVASWVGGALGRWDEPPPGPAAPPAGASGARAGRRAAAGAPRPRLPSRLLSAALSAARTAAPRPWARAARTLTRAARWALGAGAALAAAPLDLLEAWLVVALRPPPYRHVGHQLILTHTGLRPQVAPLQAYNTDRRDAWSNADLAAVVFREHCITFYKARISSLVAAAVARDGERAGGAAEGCHAGGAAAAVRAPA